MLHNYLYLCVFIQKHFLTLHSIFSELAHTHGIYRQSSVKNTYLRTSSKYYYLKKVTHNCHYSLVYLLGITKSTTTPEWIENHIHAKDW